MFCGTSPGTVLSKSLIQLSVDGLCSLPVGWPHCGGGDEGSGDLLRKVPCTHCCTQRPQPRSSHRRPTPPPETGHSRASLGQSLVGQCSFLLGPGAHNVLFVPFKSLFTQSCVSYGSFMVGLMATSSKRAYVIPSLLHPEPLPLQQSTNDPCLPSRHSNTVLFQSLWCFVVLMHTRFEPSDPLWCV